MSKSIEQIKAAFKYENEKMHKRLQVKEESLKIHIEELDRLRKENLILKTQSNKNIRKRLIEFFIYFRNNGERKIGLTIEQLVDDFLTAP